jgi:hypothetical protein
METPSVRRTDLGPRLDALREEERRRGNQDAFFLRRTRRVVNFFGHHVSRPQSGSSSRRSSRVGGSFAIEGHALFFSASYCDA